MTDKKESEAQARAREAGERAQSDAESGASGSMISEEPWGGGGNDGDSCAMTDGRPGTVRSTSKGKVCVANTSEDDEDKDSRDSKDED